MMKELTLYNFFTMEEVSSSFLNNNCGQTLHYLNLCSTWVPKMYTEVHTSKRLGFFSSVMMRKVMVCQAKLSHATKHEWLMLHQNRGSYLWDVGIQHHPRNFSSNRHFQTGKSCVLSFGNTLCWHNNIFCNIVWDLKKLCHQKQNV